MTRARRAQRVLLRVAPAIPGAFHRCVDQVEPLVVGGAVRRSGEREHLPQAPVVHARDDRLALCAAAMPVRPRMLRVRGHQPLLHSEYQVVRCVQRGRRQRRVIAPQPHLQHANRLAQGVRRVFLVHQSQRLDLLQQVVRFRHQEPAPRLLRVLLLDESCCDGHSATLDDLLCVSSASLQAAPKGLP